MSSTAAIFSRFTAVNVVGVYQMVRAVRSFMDAGEEGGNVVNVASTAGINGIGSSIAYAASKGALVTMGLSLARALGPKIRVNTVCPGFIQGDWLRKGLGDEAYEATRDRQLKNTPLRRTATPGNRRRSYPPVHQRLSSPHRPDPHRRRWPPPDPGKLKPCHA